MVKFETEEGEIDIESISPISLLGDKDKDEKKVKGRTRRERAKTGGPRGAKAPSIADSGGYCSYGEKDWEVEMDENYNPIGVYVEGIALNVSYKAWW